MGTVTYSSSHLLPPLLSLCRSLYFVLTSLYPLHDFLLAQGCPFGSQRARALSAVEEIILFLVSWTFKSAEDAGTIAENMLSAVPEKGSQLCAATVSFIYYMGMCKERKYTFSNSAIHIFLKKPHLNSRQKQPISKYSPMLDKVPTPSSGGVPASVLGLWHAPAVAARRSSVLITPPVSLHARSGLSQGHSGTCGGASESRPLQLLFQPLHVSDRIASAQLAV